MKKKYVEPKGYFNKDMEKAFKSTDKKTESKKKDVKKSKKN